MKIKTSDFLKTGEFGDLSAATSPTQVKVMFGAADAISQERRGSVVWKYGRVQFFFLRESLTQVYIYYFIEGDSGNRIRNPIIEDQFEANPTLPVVQSFLESAGVSWRIKPELTFEHQLCLETSCGVTLVFDGQHCTKIGKVF